VTSSEATLYWSWLACWIGVEAGNEDVTAVSWALQ